MPSCPQTVSLPSDLHSVSCGGGCLRWARQGAGPGAGRVCKRGGPTAPFVDGPQRCSFTFCAHLGDSSTAGDNRPVSGPCSPSSSAHSKMTLRRGRRCPNGRSWLSAPRLALRRSKGSPRHSGPIIACRAAPERRTVRTTRLGARPLATGRPGGRGAMTGRATSFLGDTRKPDPSAARSPCRRPAR